MTYYRDTVEGRQPNTVCTYYDLCGTMDVTSAGSGSKSRSVSWTQYIIICQLALSTPHSIHMVSTYNIHLVFAYNSNIHLVFAYNSNIHLVFAYNSNIHLVSTYNSNIHLVFAYNSNIHLVFAYNSNIHLVSTYNSNIYLPRRDFNKQFKLL